MYTVISFGSKEPAIYAQCADRLNNRCLEYSIPAHIEKIDFAPNADREQIVLHKPFFIKRTLQSLKSPVLWFDCDTDLIQPLPKSLPTGDWDVGFAPNTNYSVKSRIRAIAKFRRRAIYDNPTTGFAIAFNYTEQSLKFLETWKYLCAWKELAAGGDHIRMSWSRLICPVKERNIAAFLHRRAIINKGRKFERAAQWSILARAQSKMPAGRLMQVSAHPS